MLNIKTAKKEKTLQLNTESLYSPIANTACSYYFYSIIMTPMLMYKTNRIIINAEADVFVWKKAQLYGFEKKKEPEDQGGHLALDEERTGPRPDGSQCGVVWITIAIHCNGDLKHVSHSLTIWDNGSNVYFNRAEIHVIENILRQLGYGFNGVHLCDNIENFVEVSFIDINKSYPFHDLAEDRS